MKLPKAKKLRQKKSIMATGDLRGNIAQLERSLRHLKYPAAVDEVG